MPVIEIRPYTEADWAAIMEIHDLARPLELHAARLDEAFVPLREAALREGLFDYTVEVAVLDGRAAGFAAYSEDELAWLYVRPDCMRRGVGARLVARVVSARPGRTLSVEVLEGNEPARALYEKLGFAQTGMAEGAMPGNERFHVRVSRMERPC